MYVCMAKKRETTVRFLGESSAWLGSFGTKLPLVQLITLTLPHNEINLLSLITGVVFPLPSVAASAATTATIAQQPQQPQTPASNNSEQLHLQSSNKKLSHSLDHLNSSSSQVAMWRSEMEVHNLIFLELF